MHEKKKPPNTGGFCDIVKAGYFRRRKINNAAAPRPAKANVPGSGTVTTNRLNPVEIGFPCPFGPAVLITEKAGRPPVPPPEAPKLMIEAPRKPPAGLKCPPVHCPPLSVAPFNSALRVAQSL